MANEKAAVIFKKIPRSELASLPINEGQLIFVTDTGKLYLDETNTSRIQIDGKDFTYGLSIDGKVITIEKNDGSSSITLPSGVDVSAATSAETYYLTGVKSIGSATSATLYNSRVSSNNEGVKYTAGSNGTDGTLSVDGKNVVTGFYYDIS